MVDENLNPNDPNPNPAPPPPEDPETIRLRSENLRLARERDEATAAVNKQKEDQLKANQEWEKLAKQYEQERDEKDRNFKQLSSAIQNGKKMEQIKAAALKAGLAHGALEDLELLDFPEVLVEPAQNGKVLISGVDLAITKLKSTRPHWFSQTPASVNPMTPGVVPNTSGAITLDELNALGEKWRKSKSSADRAAYETALKKFKTQ